MKKESNVKQVLGVPVNISYRIVSLIFFLYWSVLQLLSCQTLDTIVSNCQLYSTFVLSDLSFKYYLVFCKVSEVVLEHVGQEAGWQGT